MNKTYLLYIKSHIDFPDYEAEVDAQSEEEAVEMFYQKLRGEFDKAFIRKHMIDEEIL